MAVIVRCKRGDGDKQGEDIKNPLIATQAMAVSRGKRYLDDPDQGGYYTCKRYEFQVPHKADILPSDSVSFTVSRLGLTDKKLRVRSYKISGDEKDVWGHIVADAAEVPT